MCATRYCLAVILVLAIAAVKLQAQEKPVALFNGKDLAGWTFQSEDEKMKMEDVWRVKQDTLICLGRPFGLLRTKESYENYVLTLQWRWTESIAGDSGVFVHTTDEDGSFGHPKSIEINLFRDHAGEFMAWGPDLDVSNEDQRKMNHVYKIMTDESAEKEMGEWNRLEITCKGNEILVKVNGKLVNHATNCTVSKGAICLESRGTLLFFRNVKLTPIKG